MLQLWTMKSVRKSWLLYLVETRIEAKHHIEFKKFDFGKILHKKVNFKAYILEKVISVLDIFLIS